MKDLFSKGFVLTMMLLLFSTIIELKIATVSVIWSISIITLTLVFMVVKKSVDYGLRFFIGGAVNLILFLVLSTIPSKFIAMLLFFLFSILGYLLTSKD